MFTIETRHVSIADSCTFQHVAMWLIVDQSLVAGFIPINTPQQRASLPFKPSVLKMKLYNNDDKISISVLTFAKPLCDNVLQPSALWAATHHTLAWQSS